MNIIKSNKFWLSFLHKIRLLTRLIRKKEKVLHFGEADININKIIIINLDRQKKRWDIIQKELKLIRTKTKKNLFDFTQRISATDAKNQVNYSKKVIPTYKLEDQYFVDPNPLLLNIIRKKEVTIELTEQEIAVAMSHIRVWGKIVKENLHNVLILEDDVYFEHNFSKKLNDIWQEIIISKRNFDILYLSYKEVDFNPELKSFSPNIKIPKRGLWWLSGYILSYSGALKLLKKLPVVGPVDLWINHLFKELNVCACSESILNQNLLLSSDNCYSILPILSQIGLKSNKTFIDLDKLKGINPVFIFDFSTNTKIHLQKIEILLSINSYRTYLNKSHRDARYVLELIERKEPLLFDAYIGFDNIFNRIPDFINLYPNALVVVLFDDVSNSLNDFILPKEDNYLFINIEDKYIYKISKALKIKNWDVDANNLCYVNPDINESIVSVTIQNEFKYIEHDVHPWVLPIQNIKNYVPYCVNESVINPIAKIKSKRFDSFKRFDENYWRILDSTFPSNLAHFSIENFSLLENIESGFQIKLTKESKGKKQYTSSSIVSNDQFYYGCFEICMKPIKGDGIISAFFLHRNDPWQEIDIEFIGNDTTKVLLNVYYNPGVKYSKYNYGVRGTPVLVDLGFDASEDFHTFRIEWEFHEIRWFVDNKIIHVRKTWTPTQIPNLPLYLYVNAWISNSESLVGKFNENILPKSLIVKHIKIYNFEYNESELHITHSSAPNGVAAANHYAKTVLK